MEDAFKNISIFLFEKKTACNRFFEALSETAEELEATPEPVPAARAPVAPKAKAGVAGKDWRLEAEKLWVFFWGCFVWFVVFFWF